MAGYIGTKAVLLSTTAATVTGDAEIAGNLTVDTNTLFVDSTNNRVGVGTASPASLLDASSSGEVVGTIRSTSTSGARQATLRLNVPSTGGDDPAGKVQFTYGTGYSVAGSIEMTHTNPNMKFFTGTTERMRIDASGNVGIGVSNPSSYQANGDNLVVGNLVDAGTGITVVSGTASIGSIHFADGPTGDDSYRGFIQYGHADNWLRFATNATERMRIKSDGQIDLGHSTPLANLASGQAEGISFGNSTGAGTFRGIVSSSGGSAALYLAKTNAFTDNRFAGFYANSNQIGSITTNGTSTSYNTSSDYRLKEDVQPMTGASERVLALNPVNFAWKADGTRVDGFLAHEAQEVVPEAVHGTKDGMRIEEYEVTPAVYDDEGNLVSEAVMGTREVPDYQGIDQSKLVPLLTAALQEALTEIAALKDRVAALEAN